MTGSFSNRKDLFHKMDYQIMKHAFSIHNQMGRFHDEEVYQNELLHLIQKDRIQAEAEVPLSIEFQTFKKTYFIDLLIDHSHIYELKALPSLSNQCRSQLINYQLISEMTYGKLINFGGKSVDHEFITSTLTKNERLNLKINSENMESSMPSIHSTYSLSMELFATWGSRLDPSLYTDAIMNLTPGSQTSRIEIFSNNRSVGSKQANLIAPDTALKITTAKHPNPLQIQLQKFVDHTQLKALLWINLNRNQITYSSLKNNPVI